MDLKQGLVAIDGQNFIPEVQVYTSQQSITSNGQLLYARVTLYPQNPFLLKAITRVVLNSTGTGTADRRFKFRLGNSDGNVYYIQAGVGDTTGDRILDTNIFGNSGAFPYVFSTPIYFCPGNAILYEIEDVSNNAPYQVALGFHGEVLIAA